MTRFSRTILDALRSPVAILTLALAAIAFAPVADALAADKVTLKDGTVLEGRIEREGDGFIYLLVKIGSIENRRLILREDIRSIDRESERADAGAPAPAGHDNRRAPRRTPSPDAIPDGAVRVAFVTLGEPPNKDMVGPFMNADALERSIEMLNKLPEAQRPQIVVLRFNSGGGALVEIEKLSDVIEDKIKPNYQVVAWIESAISAAAMTAYTIEDIYFMSKGNFGAATGFFMQGGRAQAVEGRELEEVFFMMERIAARGGHSPLVMRAMQVEQELSADIDENGVVTWRPDLNGQYIVNPKGRILTFNSLDATRYKFAKGVADTREELMRQIVGDREWVEVGQEADRYQREFRDNVFAAQVEINSLGSRLELEVQAAQSARDDVERSRHVGAARRYLSQIRSWVRRAPSLEFYMGLTPERLREIDEELREMARPRNR